MTLRHSRLQEKINLNMINDTADSCHSGKVGSHLATCRNSFSMMNIHLTKEINFFRALTVPHMILRVTYETPLLLAVVSYISGYNRAPCKQVHLFADMPVHGHDAKMNYLAQALPRSTWLPDENWLASRYLEKYVKPLCDCVY